MCKQLLTVSTGVLKKDLKITKFSKNLFQYDRVIMELNNKYHTPEGIRQSTA